MQLAASLLLIFLGNLGICSGIPTVYGRDHMARDGFWDGFGLGTLAGVTAGIAGFVAASGRASSYDNRILRLERSIQIGRPVEEVFSEWSQLENLPAKIPMVRRVDVSGEP